MIYGRRRAPTTRYTRRAWPTPPRGVECGVTRADPGGLPRAAVAALALALLAASYFVGAGAQPWLLVAATVAGLPHGALDGARGRRVFASGQGAEWVVPFGLFYLGLAAAVLLAWRVAPGTALLGFLLLSVAHFGEADGTGEGFVQRIARGGLPTVIPALAHPAMVERLFGWLAGNDAGMVEHIVTGPVAAVWAIALLLAMGRWIGDARRGAWEPLAEAAALVLLFALAPPLVAFAIYFVAIHTPRALSASAADWSTANSGTLVLLVVLAALGGTALFALGPPLPVGAAAVRASFVLLAALTIPHMALDALSRARFNRWFAPNSPVSWPVRSNFPAR